MIVEKRQIDEFTLLTIEGVVRLGESAEFFAETLQATLAEDHGHVVVDFSNINYIDSTGLGELVGYLDRFRAQKRRLILVGLNERISSLLEMSHLHDLFEIYAGIEDAMAAEG